MNKDNLTAEQQLLKVLETSTPGGASVNPQQRIEKEMSVLQIVRIANRFLILGVLALIALFSVELLSGITQMSKPVEFNALAEAARPTSSDQRIVQKLSYYLGKVDARNIFRPLQENGKKNQKTFSRDTRKIARDTAHLRLVGISWLDTVDSATVMLEDSNQEVTHTLERGESVEGTHIYIKTIYADSVELGSENEEIIIHYDQSQM